MTRRESTNAGLICTAHNKQETAARGLVLDGSSYRYGDGRRPQYAKDKAREIKKLVVRRVHLV